MRVLIGLRGSRVLVKSFVLGGDFQRGSLNYIVGYSATAQCTGKGSYLEPNSGSLHVPIEGVYRTAEKIEDRVAIGGKHNQNYVEKEARTYLEHIRNTMQKPIEGGGYKPRATATPRKEF